MDAVKLTSIKDLQCIDKASLSLTIPHDLVSIIIQYKFSETYALHFFINIKPPHWIGLSIMSPIY